MIRRTIIGSLVALALVGSLGLRPAAANVSIGINLIAPPQFVVVPGTPVAYAPAVPANYFFYGGQYYVFGQGAWFTSYGYNGPWAVLAPAYVPRPLLTVPVGYYRAAPWQWRHWHRAAPPHWAPAWGHDWRAPHREWHHGRDWNRR